MFKKFLQVNIAHTLNLKARLLRLSPRQIRNAGMILVAVVIAAGGTYTILGSHAAELPLANIEAETMSLPAGATNYSDSTASSGQAVSFVSNGSATKLLSNLPAITRIVLSAKEVSCRGDANMVFSVDGKAVLSTTVSASTWTDYSVSPTILAGDHTFSVALTNQYSWKKCVRSLKVDKFTIYQSVADSSAPSIPVGLTGSAVSASQVNLSWAASTDNVGVAGYKIYRNGSTTPIGTTTATSFSDTNLTASTAYSYSVSAYDAAANESAQTSPLQVTTAATSTSTSTTTNSINDSYIGTGINQLSYTGSWTQNQDAAAYLSDEHYTNTVNDAYTVSFSGMQAKIYTTKDPKHGIAGVSIDGGAEVPVDLYAATRANQVLVYTSPMLTQATHTLKVRVTGTKNASASDYYLVADKLDITTATTDTTTSSTGKSVWRPVGSPILSDYEAASHVRHSAWEPRPGNYTPNHTVPTAAQAQYYNAQSQNYQTRGLFTGNYTGTTDELIQWVSWKWGLDEDTVRAVAAVESWWNQNAYGFTYQGGGLTSPTWSQNPGINPIGMTSTATNLEVFAGYMRQYYDNYQGKSSWLNDVEHGQTYTTGDMWGCIGAWYAGRWHTAAADTYIAKVQDYQNRRVWEQSGF